MLNILCAISANHCELISNLEDLRYKILHNQQIPSDKKTQIKELLNNYCTMQFDQREIISSVEQIIKKSLGEN